MNGILEENHAPRLVQDFEAIARQIDAPANLVSRVERLEDAITAITLVLRNMNRDLDHHHDSIQDLQHKKGR